LLAPSFTFVLITTGAGGGWLAGEPGDAEPAEPGWLAPLLGFPGAGVPHEASRAIAATAAVTPDQANGDLLIGMNRPQSVELVRVDRSGRSMGFPVIGARRQSWRTRRLQGAHEIICHLGESFS
jgi:hypothetical protein